MAECGSPGHVRKPQGWQKPDTRQMKRQSDPAVALAAAEPQREERPVCAGGWWALPGPGPPPSPHDTARGALGDTRVLRGGQSHPASLSPQEFLTLSLHACHPLIPAALAQMGGNPTLEEITEPEIAAFRITKRK